MRCDTMKEDAKHLIGELEDQEVTERESTALPSCVSVEML